MQIMYGSFFANALNNKKIFIYTFLESHLHVRTLNRFSHGMAHGLTNVCRLFHIQAGRVMEHTCFMHSDHDTLCCLSSYDCYAGQSFETRYGVILGRPLARGVTYTRVYTSIYCYIIKMKLGIFQHFGCYRVPKIGILVPS